MAQLAGGDKPKKFGGCNLECKQKGFRLQKLKLLTSIKIPKFHLEGGKEGHEFIGPVRVVLVTTPKREYRNKTWGSAFVTLGFFAIGATVLPLFFYCLCFKVETMTNLHIMLFTAGLMFPAAFLTMNTYNGSSSILKTRHKKLDYIVLKIAGLICILGGFIASYMSPEMRLVDRVWSFQYFSLHGGIGAAAVFMCLIDFSTFPCVPCNTQRIWPKCAIVLCIPSFLMSSVCFILGILKPSFETWLPLPVILYFMIAFCIYYSFISIWNPLNNLKCGEK